MNPWLAGTLLLLTLASVTLAGWMIWWVCQLDTSIQALQAKASESLRMAEDLRDEAIEMQRRVQAWEDSRQREKEEAAQQAAAYPIGMFVPTDEDSAALEREVHRADDRFVSSRGPTLTSSRRSRAWDARSRPDASKPPEKPSGLR